MSNYIDIFAIVEGKTEQIFIKKLIAPYLLTKYISITPIQVGKVGQKGGDVKFSRVKKDLRIHLKQRSETFVTTFVDYYGVKEWPGKDSVPPNSTPSRIADIVNQATKDELLEYLPQERVATRFIPFVAIHEFETLLFSDSIILAKELGIEKSEIDSVLMGCGEPEAINDSPHTAPSKRLDNWSSSDKFPKTTTGIAIAEKIGIEKMRTKCPNFNNWLKRIEALAESDTNG